MQKKLLHSLHTLRQLLQTCKRSAFLAQGTCWCLNLVPRKEIRWTGIPCARAPFMLDHWTLHQGGLFLLPHLKVASQGRTMLPRIPSNLSYYWRYSFTLISIPSTVEIGNTCTSNGHYILIQLGFELPNKTGLVPPLVLLLPLWKLHTSKSGKRFFQDFIEAFM